MSAKSVIELWLSGGPSSLETFDPKPNAPVDYANGLKAIDTNVPGLRLHEWWPELAKCADLFSVIRTMTHPHFGHETATYLMQTGRNPGGGEVYPAIGTVIAMMKSRDYQGDLPPSVILTGAKGRFSEVGFLGERYAPLVTGGNPNSPKFVVDGIVPPGGLRPDEVDRRFGLLDLVDRFGRTDAFPGFDAAGAAARKIIHGDAAKTFDLSLESNELRDRYGRTWVGQTLLAARRLVEYGVPYVTVNLSGWDSHKRHFETIRQRTTETDRAVAALLGDLRDRKLLDSTLVWMSGEFGRTPKIDRNPPWNGGRGHYPLCFCSLVAGGGFRGGLAVGESDATATKVVKRPVTPVDFLGSVYELCGIDPEGPLPNPRGKKVRILPPPSKAGRLRELYRTLAGLALALVLPSLAPAAPTVGYLYPAGIRPGTTNRLLVCGQQLNVSREVLVSGEGVRAIKFEFVPGFPPPEGTQRRYLVSWLKGIAEGRREAPPIPEKARVDEWRSNSWWRVLGELDDLKLSIVARDLYTPRNALQMTPALRQQALVTLVADAKAKPGVREFRLAGPNGMSPPHPFVVADVPRAAEPLFAAPFRPRPKDPTVDTLPRVLDGQIFPGETDSWQLFLHKDRPVTLRTVAREFQPYIGDAVPGFFNPSLTLTDDRGREVAYADDFFYHPDPVLTFTPPADGLYTLAVHDVLYRGRADFVYSITVSESAAKVRPADVPLWPNPHDELPARAAAREFRGAVRYPGRAVWHDFDVPSVGDYVFDLLARRAGSPLDGRIEIFNADGKRLADFRDTTNTVFRGTLIQGECDPIGRFRFMRAGSYRIRISDEAGKGGPEWTYCLRVHFPSPRFEVWMSPSSFTLRPGWRQSVKVNVLRRDGFAGEIRLSETDLLRFQPSVIPAGSNTMSVAAISKARDPVPVRPIELTATARVDGHLATVAVQPADEVNQAFAWDHLLPARSFLFWGLPRVKGKKRP